MTASGSTKASLEGKLPESGGITPAIAADMWRRLGSEHVAVVVFEVAQRTEPAPYHDADPSLKLKVVDIELARDDDEAEYLRTILRGIYRLRTKADTLDDENDDAADTIASARGSLSAALIEAAEAQGWTVTMTAHGPIIDIPNEGKYDTAYYARRAAEIVIRDQAANLAALTRKLHVPAAVAHAALDVLAAHGVVSEADELRNRDVLVPVEQLPGVLAKLAADFEGLEPGVCKFCGCTEDEACDGGCAWMDDTQTLCSACAEKVEQDQSELVGADA